MGAPGTGVGRAGVWQAGVEVDPTVLIQFDLVSEATLTFAGVAPEMFVGNFDIEGEAGVEFSGVAEFSGNFDLSASATLGFDGVDIPTLSGNFEISGVAAVEFSGESAFEGMFGLNGSAIIGFAGVGETDGAFSLGGEALLSALDGINTRSGTFSLTGEAVLDMIWMPCFQPGTATAGCGTDPNEVTDTVGLPTASLSDRKDC
ncbi:MAG: hypothetical protein DRH08_01265 [Deltaproteobacteria bacterium]|nr:MAG: hypothetical protein DRH08_01265 [Deltaproteobacteria bacterium]